jgi:DNA primase
VAQRSQREGGREDPVARLERQVLEVVLQLPSEARVSGFDDLPTDAFAVPAHRAVHDAIRAAGGVSAAEGTARWAEAVRESAAETVVPLVTELVVAPLPQDRPEALGAYARGVLAALAEMGITRKIADARSLLQRTDPADPAYGEIFAELVHQEQQRRALRGEG